ncbi:GIY-YIG nuclease family protein [Reichenbachiella sp.]|uniref:GIY-YIG nuclease family protein n=1 Tax=Reichenbachiella sp. TaxID=2184521 RepID=UPI003B599450
MTTNQPYTVYILKCANNSYYTGVTSDIERRIWEHETGFHPTSYTYHKRPIQLVFQDILEISIKPSALKSKSKAGAGRKRKH